MIVNEIRSAVIDTINFIIPPFVKLLISIVIAYYITHGKITDVWFDNVQNALLPISLENVKLIIDKLYLSAVMPILSILILIAIAYIINSVMSMIGSLIPFRFYTTNQLAHHYLTKNVWTALPEIQGLGKLDLKVNQIVERLIIENNSPYANQLTKEKEKRSNKFAFLNFIYFLLIFSFVSYFGTQKYSHIAIECNRFYFAILLYIVIVVVTFLRIADNTYKIQEVKLMIVDYWLQSERNFSIMESRLNDDFLEDINDRIKQRSKWWSVSFGYNFDWLKMYKYYRFKPPFYSIYRKFIYKKKGIFSLIGIYKR